jgi:hypothetical protein
MIITREQLKEVTGCDYYDGSILNRKFAYKFLQSKIHPLGNIITFISPANKHTDLTQGSFASESMVHFCVEIPNLDILGGVSFQRLYNTIIAEILSRFVDAPTEVDDGNIFIRKEFSNKGIIISRGKASVTNIVGKQDSVLIHTGINLVAGASAPVFAYSTELTPENTIKFQKACEDAFYQTIASMFLSASKATA